MGYRAPTMTVLRIRFEEISGRTLKCVLGCFVEYHAGMFV
jgi:hypothetical protein